jgi:histidyl-tRNA synthetase
MECLSHKSEIVNTFSNVRSFSYQEKKTPLMDEERVNSLLDAIIDFKNSLKEKTNKIYDVNERIEKITWFNELDEESLMLLNDLISSAKDLRTSLIRQFISLNSFRRKGIAKEEIKDFKNSIDELKESYEDLESVFFFLPEMPDFAETTAKLSLV